MVIFLCMAVTLIQRLSHHSGSFINSPTTNFEQKHSFSESDIKGVLDLTKALWL